LWLILDAMRMAVVFVIAVLLAKTEWSANYRPGEKELPGELPGTARQESLRGVLLQAMRFRAGQGPKISNPGKAKPARRPEGSSVRTGC
jgi:hypothetical protein